METLVPAAICHHGRIRVATERAMEFIDLTDRVEALVAEAGIYAGLVNIQSLHTTTAIVINEHEPLLRNMAGNWRWIGAPAASCPSSPLQRPPRAAAQCR